MRSRSILIPLKIDRHFVLQAVVEERLILQFHFTEWHSHTCPFSNALLEFRRRVRAVVGHRIKSNEAGPMVVHCKYVLVSFRSSICYLCFCCSDGGGRSGVYLAIDANLELGEEEDAFDVYGYLKKLRQSRKGLVDNVVSVRNSVVRFSTTFALFRINTNSFTIRWRSFWRAGTLGFPSTSSPSV